MSVFGETPKRTGMENKEFNGISEADIRKACHFVLGMARPTWNVILFLKTYRGNWAGFLTALHSFSLSSALPNP